MKPRRLHRLTIFSMVAATTVSGGLLIRHRLTQITRIQPTEFDPECFRGFHGFNEDNFRKHAPESTPHPTLSPSQGERKKVRGGAALQSFTRVRDDLEVSPPICVNPVIRGHV